MGAQKLPKTSRGSHQKTLDMEHSAALSRLHNSLQDFSSATEAKDDLARQIAAMEARGKSSLSEAELDDLLRLKDARRAIDKDIEDNRQKCDEVEYYLKTGGILFNYYEIIDKGSTSGTPIDHKKSIATNKNSIMKYFMGGCAPGGQKENAEADEGEEERPLEGAEGLDDDDDDDDDLDDDLDNEDDMDLDDAGMKLDAGGGEEDDEVPKPAAGKIKINRAPSGLRRAASAGPAGEQPQLTAMATATATATAAGHPRAFHHQASIGKRFQQLAAHGSSHLLANDRASLLEKYLMHTDKDFIKIEQAEDPDHAPCSHCTSTDRTVIIHDGYTFCNSCFTVEYVLVDHEKPSYKEPPKEITYFSYKRINHFNEWLNQIQGKETTEIPEEVYDKILLEIKKQKINNMASLTNAKVRDILKKLKINKYYEHVPHIINRLSGISMPHITPELEERLRHMFCQIQVPFLKHSPPTRKNFLSYSYVLHKFMQLLEKDQYLPSFPLLKSRDKLLAQDAIWAKICKELGWEFVRSL